MAFAVDGSAAKGDFFAGDGNSKKFDNIHVQLDRGQPKEKLEAMKRLIEMMSKGRDVSMFFPDVVKNVVSPSLEVKKLVYMFLVRYAEVKQELALLAINSFQKDMADKNQLIRALALRVMASIRVLDIVQLIILAIRKCATDSSPYVRKAAAHAIPKVYSLDTTHQHELIEIIATLLKDNSTMVLGSAIAAFNEVCPDNFELIHQHFRKLCHLLVDTNEWGQIMIINMLLRYGRAMFMDVTEAEKGDQLKEAAFYSDEEENSDNELEKSSESKYEMDPDHRLLLKSVLPLCQSRNTGVVLAVATLYFHLAPPYESQKMGKSLVRIMRGSNEVQYVVLANIATMAATRPSMFTPYMKEFFVRSSEPSYCRVLKLEILTHIATAGNISVIMKEFKTYVKSDDEALVTATIQAIGRCAARLPDVADQCLRSLMHLLGARSENVVAEAVIEIKKIVQTHPDEHDEVLTTLAKMMDSTVVPSARSSIVWLIGQYCKKIPKIAPDVLRKLAKTFCDEDDNVKLQTLNLALKLFVTNPTQTTKLFQYVLSMARYDASYDIRDRARLIRRLTNVDGKSAGATLSAAEIESVFLADKPIPLVKSPSDERSRFTIGTLSHLVGHQANGYEPLPDHPSMPSDRKLRDPPVDATWREEKKPAKPTKAKSFYSDSESGSYTDSDSYTGSGSYSDSYTSDSDASRSTYSSRSSRSHSMSSGSYSSDSDTPVKSNPPPQKPSQTSDSLFDLLAAPTAPVGSVSSPDSLLATFGSMAISNSNSSRPLFPLLNPMNGGGLGVQFSFPRESSLYGARLTTVRLHFHNQAQVPLQDIRITDKRLEAGQELREFEPIPSLQPGAADYRSVSINFNGKVAPVRFDIATDRGQFTVKLTPPAGELLRPYDIAPKDFDVKQGKLGGMNENTATVRTSASPQEIMKKAMAEMAVAPVELNDECLKLSGRAVADDTEVFASIQMNDGAATIKVNTDSLVLGTILLEVIKKFCV